MKKILKLAKPKKLIAPHFYGRLKCSDSAQHLIFSLRTISRPTLSHKTGASKHSQRIKGGEI